MARDPQEHIKLRPQILNLLMDLSSTAQDERNTARFDSLRKLTELINVVYATVKLNGLEIDGLVRTHNKQLEEIAELHKTIERLENEKKAVQTSLNQSNQLVRQILSVDPTINSKIPQYEIKKVLGNSTITNPAVKQYLKVNKVA